MSGKPSVTKHYDKKEGVWTIRGFTTPIKDALVDGGCEWDGKRICWVYPGEDLPQQVVDAINGNLSVEASMKPVDMDAIRNRRMSEVFRQLAKKLDGSIRFQEGQMREPNNFRNFNEEAKKNVFKTMAGAKQEWDRLIVLQEKLETLADQWESGKVEPILHRVASTALFNQLVKGVQIKQLTITHSEFNVLYNAASKRDVEVMKTLNAMNLRMSKAKTGEIVVKANEADHVEAVLKSAAPSVAPNLRNEMLLLHEIVSAGLEKADKWAAAVKAIQSLTTHEVPVPVIETTAAPAPEFNTVVRRAKHNGVTPLIQHYRDIKAQYPDAVVLFQLGDFYEAFGEDAEKLAQVCDVVLTARPINRTEKIPMAGIPRHSIVAFKAMLVAVGHKVAIAVETENRPSGQAGILERRVLETTETVETPAAKPEEEPALPTV